VLRFLDVGGIDHFRADIGWRLDTAARACEMMNRRCPRSWQSRNNFLRTAPRWRLGLGRRKRAVFEHDDGKAPSGRPQ